MWYDLEELVVVAAAAATGVVEIDFVVEVAVAAVVAVGGYLMVVVGLVVEWFELVLSGWHRDDPIPYYSSRLYFHLLYS